MNNFRFLSNKIKLPAPAFMQSDLYNCLDTEYDYKILIHLEIAPIETVFRDFEVFFDEGGEELKNQFLEFRRLIGTIDFTKDSDADMYMYLNHYRQNIGFLN